MDVATTIYEIFNFCIAHRWIMHNGRENYKTGETFYRLISPQVQTTLRRKQKR